MITRTWLGELEGLRGLAALWVFSMHVALLSGTKIPIISWGAYGVDLFILLSGFLMVHQFEQRKETQKWSDARTINRFWLRRFFRIAPLYYLLLTVAFISDPLLQRARLSIGNHYAATLTNGLRYSDRSLENVLTHASFVFGISPHFSFQTPLPDWSIGLEMQFYFAFPFLMLAAMRFGYLWMVMGTLILDASASVAYHKFYSDFVMPSFLPLKIHLFLLGMLIAAAFHKSFRYIGSLILPICFFPLFIVSHYSKMEVIVDILLAVLLVGVTQIDLRVRSALTPITYFLNSWMAQKLGDISYSVYLVHLLIVLPITAMLLSFQRISSMPDPGRFLVTFGASSLLVFPVSMLLFRYIEKPGIEFGKNLLTRIAKT